MFLDETGVNLAMLSLYARSLKGARAYSKRPLKRGKNVSLIGAMTLEDGFLTGLSFDGGKVRRYFFVVSRRNLSTKIVVRSSGCYG